MTVLAFLVIGWACGSVVGVFGCRGFLRAEQDRLDRMDRAVRKAWDVVERELNPSHVPPSEPKGLVETMMSHRLLSDLPGQLHPLQCSQADMLRQRANQAQGMAYTQQANQAQGMIHPLQPMYGPNFHPLMGGLFR